MLFLILFTLYTFFFLILSSSSSSSCSGVIFFFCFLDGPRAAQIVLLRHWAVHVGVVVIWHRDMNCLACVFSFAWTLKE